jgi:hypothetical protein
MKSKLSVLEKKETLKSIKSMSPEKPVLDINEMRKRGI